MFTRVQGTGIASTTTVSSQAKAFTSSVTAGNMISVNAFGNGGGNTITLSVTDSQGNTYTVDSTNTGSLANMIARSVAVSTGTLTVTVASTKLALISFSINEISTSGNSFSVDSTSTGTGISGTTLSTGSLSLSESDFVIAGFGMSVTGLTYTAGALFTIDFSNNTVSEAAFASEYYINTSGSSVTPSITTTATSAWNAASVSYKLNINNIYSSDSSLCTESYLFSDSLFSTEFSTGTEQFILQHQYFDSSLSSDTQQKSILFYDMSIETESYIFSCSLFSVDSGVGLEGIYFTSSIAAIVSADSSSSVDQQTVINSFIFSDSSISSESQLRSSSIYQTDFCFADLNPQLLTNSSIIISKISYDVPAIGLDVQSTHNVLATFSADAAFGSETIYRVTPAANDADAGSASDTNFRINLSFEFSTSKDSQVISSYHVYSTDQALSLESQLISILGGMLEDKNPATASESSFPIHLSGDLSHELDANFLSSSIINSSITDHTTGIETQLPQILNSDHPSAIEYQYRFQTFFSTDSGLTQNIQLLSPSVFSIDSAIAKETSILFKSFILVGTAIVDSAIGSEAALPIRSSGDSPSGQERQQTFLLPSGPFNSSFESAHATETPLKIIRQIDRGIPTDIDFLFSSFVSYSSAITDSSLGTESQLRIGLSSESPVSINNQIRIFFNSQDAHAIDQYFVFSSFIDVSGAVAELAIGSEAFLRIMLAGDFGYSFDTQYSFIIPQPSITTLTDVLNSIRAYIKSTGLFGPDNVDYVVNEIDSHALYPTTPGPICLLEPKEQIIDVSNIGGGRYEKLWIWNIRIYIMVNNYLDQAFKDIVTTTFNGVTTGIHELVHLFSRSFEQAYITNQFNQPVMVEFMYNGQFGQIYRYKQSNSYNGIAIDYSFKYLQSLPLNIPYMFNNQDIQPQVQWGSLTGFYTSILGVLNMSGLFGNGGVDFAIPSDSNYKWPINPCPFVLIEPQNLPDSGEAVGGGRWTKVYEGEFKVHVISNDIIDVSYRDTELVSQINPLVNIYNLVDQTINWLDQSWPVRPGGLVTVVELPRAIRIEEASRYAGANHLSDICISFIFKFCENMDNTHVNDSMPN